MTLEDKIAHLHQTEMLEAVFYVIGIIQKKKKAFYFFF